MDGTEQVEKESKGWEVRTGYVPLMFLRGKSDS